MVTTPLIYVDQNRLRNSSTRSSGVGGSDHRHCFTGMFILWYEYTNPNTVALVGGRSLGRNQSSGLASSYTCAGSPLLRHRKVRRSTKELGSKTLSERAGIIPKNLTWLRHCAAATARTARQPSISRPELRHISPVVARTSDLQRQLHYKYKESHYYRSYH